MGEKESKKLGERFFNHYKSFGLLVGICLLLSLNGAEPRGENKESSSEEMKCVCDGGCENIVEEDCPFSLTLDVCGCCFVCARGENEPCGGVLGTCAIGLRCFSANDTRRCTRDKTDCGTVPQKFGCFVKNGDCICEEKIGCDDEEMFLFDSEESCRTKLAFLISRRNIELPTTTTRSTDDCAKIQCPPVTECPEDSFRLPGLIDPNHKHPASCCPSSTTCHCNPGIQCNSIECFEGMKKVISVNSSGLPGGCCPKYKCIEHSSEMIANDEEGICRYQNNKYLTGESWVNDEECTQCFCKTGVISCKPMQCEPLPNECHLARAVHGSCCPLCAGCISNSGIIHNNSDIWYEDICTTCECTQGKIKCHATLCQPGCLNPIFVEGECCPQCKDDHSCPTLAHCTKDCLQGYETNENGCAICQCKSNSNKSTVAAEVISSTKCHLEIGVERFDGEEWSDCDGKRHCICKNGTEMCSLVSCSAPMCEHPVFYAGDCCPRCIDAHDETRFHQVNASICQSSDGKNHVEGEMWKLGTCLTCTCHKHGQILCSSPQCPPVPCEANFIEREGECCWKCPQLSLIEKESRENGNTVTKSNCFSDDLQKSYSDGEMWKVGCQSCICRNGEIKCFSGRKCPPLNCARPVLAKDMCCPMCLPLGGKEDSFSPTTYPSDLNHNIEINSQSTGTGGTGGVEPHCAIIIALFSALSIVVIVYLVRRCLHSRRTRLIKQIEFRSTNSSPNTPDCCYKYTSYNQISEQKTPLCPDSLSDCSSLPISNSTNHHYDLSLSRSDRV